MYRRRYCLKWRFNLILNSRASVSICLMFLGRVLSGPNVIYSEATWYLVVFAKGGRNKSRLLVL